MELEGLDVKLKISSIENQASLASYEAPLDDYMEVVISYGYVILFSAAFPLVPLIAYICNSLELRIDAWKLCNLTRRPHPDVAGSIGMWGSIMRFICYAGAITNTAIIVFTAGIFDMV